jgi:hypothetical protein
MGKKVGAMVGLFALGCGGESEMDAIYARRMIDAGIITPPVYQTPTLAAHYTSTDFVYWKDVDGTLRFKGSLSFDGTTSGWNVVVFSLPVGFRPPADTFLPTCTANLGTLITTSIYANGDVRFQTPGGAAFTAYTNGTSVKL